MIVEQKHCEAVLDFVGELQTRIDGDFPRDVLRLLSKHFQFDQLTFFPRYSNETAYPIDRPDSRFDTNFIAMGLHRDRLQLYVEHYHKTDIFQPHNLPLSLNQAPVVSVEDVMSYQEFSQTEYHRFLSHYDMHYQMCIFLNLDGMRLGTIGVFRTRSRGDFTDYDRWVAGKVSGYIAQAYKLSVDISRARSELDMHRKSHEKLPVGILMLDSSFTVVECNDHAGEYCLDIREAERGRAARDDNFVLLGASARSDVQAMISQIRPTLLQSIDSGETFQLQGRKQLYHFSTSSFFVMGFAGNVQTCYSVYITTQPLEAPDPVELGEYGLTRRESEVTALIAQGCTNKQIAERMFISSHTVKAHIMKIFAKTGVKNRTELICRLSGTRTAG